MIKILLSTILIVTFLTVFSLPTFASEATGTVSGGFIGVRTVTNPNPTNMANEATAGLLSISGSTPSATTNFTFNVEYVLKDGTATVNFPADTVVTKTGGGDIDLTKFGTTDNTIEIKNEVGTTLGSIKIGIPNVNLTFSKSITVIIPVGSAYDSQTLTAYYRAEGSAEWLVETTCVVTGGNCTFQTTHATTFAARENVTATSTTTLPSTSVALSTQTAICTDANPGAKAPWLYGAITQGANSVLLYFTANDNPVTKYVLEYGTKTNNYSYGVLDMGINSSGQMTYLVKSLSQNTTYYFRVRASNGCATGSWSNEIAAKTSGMVSVNSLEFKESTLEVIPNNSPTTTIEPSKKPVEVPTFTGYDVKVIVVDTNKKPIEHASVTLHSNPQTAKTNKDGIAEFKNVEQGDHKVIIAYNNFQGEQSLNLTGDVKEFDLSITVKQTPFAISPLAYGITGILILIILSLVAFILKSRKK
jgi:hypothetical protein